MTRSAPRAIWASWLLAALCVLATLLAGELVVRAFDLGPSVFGVSHDGFVPSDDPVLRYEPRPYAPDLGDRYSSAGLRDREFSVEKPPGVYRIAVMGDSITFGHGLPREDSWPKQLEALLDRAALPGAPRFEVMNFAVTGYNVAQIVQRLRTLALRYEPDLVLYGYTLNDPQDYSFQATMLEALSEEGERRTREWRSGGIGQILAGSRLYLMGRELVWMLRSQPVEVTMRLDPGFVADARGRRHEYFRELHRRRAPRKRLEEGFAMLGAISRDEKLPILVAIFPLLQEEPGEPYALADVHDLVSELAREDGLDVVDLLPSFDAARETLHESFGADMMHPNPLGHRVAARAILRAIAPREPALLDPERVPPLQPEEVAGSRQSTN